MSARKVARAVAAEPSADGSQREDAERSPYRPVGDIIADHLRAAILDGRLAPGERIRQGALGNEFGVSRIPVREALRQLEREGLVTLVPHSGARVARLHFEEHLEIYIIREAIEPVAIAYSAPRLTDEQLQQLRDMATAFEHIGAEPTRWLEADRQFHLATYAAAGLPQMLRMIEGFWNTSQRYRRAYLATLTAEDRDLVHLEHRLILNALERHDAVDAETRQRSHIRRTRLRLTEHRDLFSD